MTIKRARRRETYLKKKNARVRATAGATTEYLREGPPRFEDHAGRSNGPIKSLHLRWVRRVHGRCRHAVSPCPKRGKQSRSFARTLSNLPNVGRFGCGAGSYNWGISDGDRFPPRPGRNPVEISFGKCVKTQNRRVFMLYRSGNSSPMNALPWLLSTSFTFSLLQKFRGTPDE